MSTAGNAPSLFHITRCAQNRLPCEQPAPAPNSEPTAIALRSPHCLANSPGRPNAHPGRTTSPTPDPFALPYPEKNVTLPRHPFPPLPHPTPHTPHQSPRLRHFSPPIRPNPAISPTLLKHPHIRATLAHARDRPRGPETPTPTRVRPQASQRRRKLVTGHRPAPCPTLSRGATFVSQQLAPGITDWSRTGDTLSYESHRMSQKLTEFAVPSSREQRSWGHPVI